MDTKANSSKAAVVTSVIIGKISSIFGYAIAFIFVISLLGGAFHDVGSIIIVLVFLCIAAALILNGIKIKRRYKRFKKYIGLISVENQTSLDDIANSTMQSVDFVTKDIQSMIDKKFFLNAQIDRAANQIVLQKRTVQQQFASAAAGNSADNAPAEMITVTCKNCGAINSIQKGTPAECEFCGSPLK